MVGSMSALYASSHEIDPSIRLIISSRFFPYSSDSRKASCQLLVKECALNTGKQPPGGLQRNIVVKGMQI